MSVTHLIKITLEQIETVFNCYRAVLYTRCPVRVCVRVRLQLGASLAKLY